MPLTLVNNTIMLHKLGVLRNSDTPAETFRRLLGELSVQLFFAAADTLAVEEVEIATPLATTTASRVSDKLSLVPVMRAGNGMLEAILRVWPQAWVGHVGIYRDKFLNNTVEYYFKMPAEIGTSTVMLMDPIIATGETAMASIERLKEVGCSHIQFLSIVTSRQGMALLEERHPDVHIFSVTAGEDLTDEGFASPGIGDVGARFYNTR